MLEWFLFCKIELIVSPSLLSVQRSYSKNFQISRFSIMLEKNLFRTSVFSNSALRILPFSDKFILSLAIQTVMVLQFFKKVCCYYVFFIKVRIFFFFFFTYPRSGHNSFFVLYAISSFPLFSSEENCYAISTYSWLLSKDLLLQMTFYYIKHVFTYAVHAKLKCQYLYYKIFPNPHHLLQRPLLRKFIY